MAFRVALACAFLWLASAAPLPRQSPPDDGVTRLVALIEQAVRAGDAAALRALARSDAPAAPFNEFVQMTTAVRPSLVSIKERDRAAIDGGRVRLMLEMLVVTRSEGHVSTWRVDAAQGQPNAAWQIAGIERLTVVNGLFQLSLDATTEYTVKDLVVNAPDLTLTIPSGEAFYARTPDGPTAIVVMGHGQARLAPAPAAEKGQVRQFSGSDVFGDAFDALYIRVNPADLSDRLDVQALTPKAAVDPAQYRRATQIFGTYVGTSFQIDLNDLNTDRWSLVPSISDFVAEIVTRKYGVLTYARASAEPEDISFFDRRRRRNIAVYASPEKLAARGPFYSEDERVDFDVTHYDLDVAFSPDRLWVDGAARMSIHTRTLLSTITLRLADPLVVRGVSSPRFGRLLHLRVVGQNNVLVGLPGTIAPGTDLDLVVTYGGRLAPQPIDREAIQVQQQDLRPEEINIPAEPQYVYSNRSFWYPQAVVTDYAQAKMTITVPAEYDVVASGTPQGTAQIIPGPAGQHPQKKVVFDAVKPARYLSCVISRFQGTVAAPLKLPDGAPPVQLIVTANPRLTNRIRATSEKAADILSFYTSVMGDFPYDSFTVALTESDLPGGHSPAYFAMLNQPLPTSQYSWSDDPVAFGGFPSFFIAHEIAHQWWGQGVGWKNYHEQWLSEGFAQYFAAMYAERERGAETFTGMLRTMKKWAIETSPQGPVYLGYRLGHLKGDSRVFRALVYNKGAMVLHMLRRLVGDESFFAGLREFYTTWRFQKAGTDDFRKSMEKAAGRPLDRFFDRWIYGTGIPAVRFSSTVNAQTLHVRFDQIGDIYDVPITVTITYADNTSEEVVVPVTDRTVERTIPLKGKVRGVEANKDSGALVKIER